MESAVSYTHLAVYKRQVFMENGLVVDEGTPAYLFGPDSNERVQAFLSKIL